MDDDMIAVVVPEECEPVFREVIPCECALHPVKMTYRKGSLHWVVTAGDEVKEGQLLCEASYENKLVEFHSPAEGEVMIVLGEGEKIQKDDILAYIMI